MELCKTEVQIAKRGFTDVQNSLHSFKVVRECAKCGQVKEITEFYLTGQEGKKYRTKVCKVCERKKKRETFKAVNKEPFWEKLFIGNAGIIEILEPYFT
mgnify:CR=1 FL=1